MPASPESRVFRYSSRALALLGIRTSVVIATILAIPDAVALIPGSASFTGWAINLLGCWITALVLWFVFFTGMLHAMRIASGGVQVDDTHIKLWRFAKPIAWSDVRSVGLETEGLFSKIFSYEHAVRRLTIYSAFKGAPGLLKGMIVPRHIPSFFFDLEDFDELARLSLRYYGAVEPTRLHSGLSADVVAAGPEDAPSIRKTFSFIRWQRVVVSLLISVGIVLFLGRKAVVLYSYNVGLKEFRAQQFEPAIARFETATRFEPTFAPAWHGLAAAEFNLGRFEKAKRHWQTSLVWKPDYVEAKVSLAYMSICSRDFQKADQYLSSALSLAPADSTALLNRADLYLRTGHLRDAIRDARLVLTRHRSGPETFMARCLLADARLIQGRPEEARDLIAPLPIEPEPIAGGANLTYRLLVGARTNLALGEVSVAENLAERAISTTRNVDTLLVLSDVEATKGDSKRAQELLNECRKLMPTNPWVYIKAAKLNASMGKRELAIDNLTSARNCKSLDALSLSSLAQLYSGFGEADLAAQCARMSLKMEPVNPSSLSVLRGDIARGSRPES